MKRLIADDEDRVLLRMKVVDQILSFLNSGVLLDEGCRSDLVFFE